MSQETSRWLNTKVLVGNGKKPWHNKPSEQVEGSNQYPGFIPVEEVLRRLFNFDVNAQPVFTKNAAGELFEVEGWKAQVPTDRDAVFGIHSDKYVGHQYHEWLIEYVSKLVNGQTGIGTAGLLKGGAQAWVQIEVPEIFRTIQGVDFRSFLLAGTAFDGSAPTRYKLAEELAVCDNTVERAFGEKGLQFAIRHTKGSNSKIEDAQVALHLIEREQELFAEEIKTLCEWDVTEAQFQSFLAKLVPLPEQKKELDINKRDYSTRTATIAAQKREKLNELYRADKRIAPWKGTAFGVRQLVNTFNQHENKVHKSAESRYLRNTANLITGKTAEADNEALALLAKITNKELVFA